MFKSIRLGTASGIPLFVHPTFFLLPLFVAAMSLPLGPVGVLFSQVVLVSMFACVLLHELGHALMGRAFGIGTRDITLFPIGGVARLDSTGHKPHEEILIALAGPAVNLVIAALLSPVVALVALSGVPIGTDAAGGLPGFVATWLVVLWVGNLVLLGFNLIPAYPMDGGRVLRAVLTLGLGLLRATEIAVGIGTVIALGLGILGLYTATPSLVLVAVFVAVVGQLELITLRRRKAAAVAESIPTIEIHVPPAKVEHAGFTGFAWDRHNQVFVRWVDGRPVEIL